jgi:hypothetical protein
MDPKNAYLEFEAHPANITPYTLNEVKANINNNPAFIFAITKYSDNGITDQTNKEGTSIIIGAVKNKPLLALDGIITSFVNNFITSAIG